MAALTRPSTASYEIHESVRVDTEDNEDHTFCGIAFPVKAHKYLPVERLEIHSVSVRGDLGESSRNELGNVTVWISKENREDPTSTSFPMNAANFIKVFDQKLKASRPTYVSLKLDQAIVLHPGQTRMVYVHSTAPGDDAIVYDNSQYESPTRYHDDFLSIYSGKAHLSPVTFGLTPIWGWGTAWRDRREFVGKLHYGVTFKLWNPDTHTRFGSKFDKAVHSMLLLQRNDDCPVARLPDECIYYIFNMMKWDWFEDNGANLKTRYRVKKQRPDAKATSDTAADVVMQEEEADEAAVIEVQEEVEDAVMEESDEDSDGFFHDLRPTVRVFHVDAASSDEEEEEDETQAPVVHHRQGWLRSRFARGQLLRAFGRFQQDVHNDDSDSSYLSDS